jgi:hypothetical protein
MLALSRPLDPPRPEVLTPGSAVVVVMWGALETGVDGLLLPRLGEGRPEDSRESVKRSISESVGLGSGEMGRAVGGK